MSEPELDPGLQERLHALAEAEHTPLDDVARERATRRVVDAVQAGEHRVSRLAGGGGDWKTRGLIAGGLAAAAALLFLLRGPSTDPDRTAATDRATAPGSGAPACALAAALAGAQREPVADGGSTLRLGEHALVVAEGATRVTPSFAEPCRLELGLTRGRVAVHARDLDGGELWVRTGAGDVIVHGTVFSVEAEPGVLRVALVEGAVSVEREGRELARLEPGERIALEGERVERAALEPDRAEALRRRLGLAPAVAPDAPGANAPAGQPVEADAPAGEPVEPPARTADTRRTQPRGEPGGDGDRRADETDETGASPEALVARADAARRQGRLADARRLYRQAGASRGPAAEVAWLRLAHLELEAGRAPAARAALDTHDRRFARGPLAAEAAWIRVELARRSGNARALRAAAEALIAAHPRSPQATAARRLLEGARSGDP